MNSKVFNKSLFLRYLSTIRKHETWKYKLNCTQNVLNRIKSNEFRGTQINFYSRGQILYERLLPKDNDKSFIFISQSNTKLTKIKETGVFPFPVHQYEFWALQDYYLSIYATSNNNVPTLGIKINMSYIDTAPFAKATMPIVVILHGAPGSHEDFTDLITFLSKQDIRVIAPNFPGYDFTALDHNKEFHHSLEEKSALIKDFLDILKVQRVDVLIGHGVGAYPCMFLCSNFKLFHSLVLINPYGLRPARSLPDQWFLNICDICFKSKLLQSLVPLLVLLMPSKKFKSTPPEHTAVILETIANPDYKKITSNATELCLKLYPKAVVVCDDDEIIEPEISLELLETLGCSVSTEHHLNKNSSQDNPEHFKRVIRIKKGGHSAMRTHPSLINTTVMDILNFVRKKKK